MYECIYEFMGLSYAFHMNFWALSMNSLICTNIRMLLDNAFPDLSWNLCRREERGFFSLHAHALRDCVVHVQYHLPHVSNYD